MTEFAIRRLVIGLLICQILSACTVSRQKRVDKKSVCSDSLSVAREDSIHYQRLLQVSDRMAVRLQHITFSPPDSLGKQYLQQLTVADVQRYQAESLQDTFSVQSAFRTHRVSAVQTKEQAIFQSKRTCFRTIFRLVLGMVVLGIILFCWRKKGG